MLNKIMLITAEIMLTGLVVAAVIAALLWADQKERELGISGMSSERILAQENK
jgi:hypothetical protein